MKALFAGFRSTHVWPVVALALAACSGDMTEVVTPETPQLTEQRPPRVRLVKFGPAGETATFSVSATGGTLLLGSTVTVQSCPHDAACPAVEVWAPTGPEEVQVTVTEIATSIPMIVERINVISDLDGIINIDFPADPTVTVRVDGVNSATVRFKNIIDDTPPPEPSLRIVKNALDANVDAGQGMGFVIDVYSDGPGTATNVTLSDPLPGGPGIDWVTTTAGCAVTGVAPVQTLSCDFGDMAAGAQASVTVMSATTASTPCSVYNNTASVSADNHGSVEASASVTVENCDTDTQGSAGCTPGFWKQKHHYEFWTSPYTPSTLFSDVFEDAFPGKTLLQVLQAGGGDLTALGRHTVAALLNGASPDVDYGMSAASVISAFNAAFPGGDYEGLKNVFEDRNERGCTAKD